MDLTTLDPTQPPGSQAVSQGDDRIRETRDAIISSFGGLGRNGTGGTQPEHNLNGTHHFQVQDPSFRPAAGNPGRIFFDATNQRAEFDTGSIWSVLHTVQGKAAVFNVPVSLDLTFKPVVDQTINAGNGTNIVVIGTVFVFATGPGVNGNVQAYVDYNGSALDPGQQRSFVIPDSNARAFQVMGFGFGTAAGAVTVRVLVTGSVSAGLSVSKASLVALAF